MLEHGRAVICQMLIETDGLPLDPAEQSGEPLLALDQRQVAQVRTVVLQQVKRIQHCLRASVSAPQRMEVRPAVVSGDHDFAVDQERVCLKAGGGFDNGREAVGPVVAVPGEAADAQAIPAHHQPIAVVLDFVNPQRAGRRLGTPSTAGRV